MNIVAPTSQQIVNLAATLFVVGLIIGAAIGSAFTWWLL